MPQPYIDYYVPNTKGFLIDWLCRYYPHASKWTFEKMKLSRLYAIYHTLRKRG